MITNVLKFPYIYLSEAFPKMQNISSQWDLRTLFRIILKFHDIELSSKRMCDPLYHYKVYASFFSLIAYSEIL